MTSRYASLDRFLGHVFVSALGTTNVLKRFWFQGSRGNDLQGSHLCYTDQTNKLGCLTNYSSYKPSINKSSMGAIIESSNYKQYIKNH